MARRCSPARRPHCPSGRGRDPREVRIQRGGARAVLKDSARVFRSFDARVGDVALVPQRLSISGWPLHASSRPGGCEAVDSVARAVGTRRVRWCSLSPPRERPLSVVEIRRISERTLAHYEANAEAFREGTRDHDVSQNYAAFLRAIEGAEPFRILDVGCGPGRDVAYFRSLGHDVVGLDGSARFVEMARDLTGCEILEQDFLALSLGAQRFDGIFANASLFHVPTSELARVLGELRDALLPRGVFFSSNPRGQDTEGFSGERYGAFHTMETWRAYLVTAGFAEIEHYYRPAGRPRAEQPWLASVWRKKAAPTREAF